MTDRGADSKLFAEVTRELLAKGVCVRFQARGASMSPAIRDGDMVQVTPVIVSKLRKDDIVLTKATNGLRLHRLVVVDHAQDVFITRGDCGQQDDPAVSGEEIVGLAVAKEVRVGRSIFQAKFQGVGGNLLRAAARGQAILKKRARTFLGALSLSLLLLAAAPYSRAQVAVDNTSSAQRQRTGAGTVTNNFTHTTTAGGVNRLLIVSVEMNIRNSAATGVIGITYNGTALNILGSHNDAGNTRRVEMWYTL